MGLWGTEPKRGINTGTKERILKTNIPNDLETLQFYNSMLQKYGKEFKKYLRIKPRIRGQIALEIDHPIGAAEGSWLSYDDWPTEWKQRLLVFYIAFAEGKKLPLANPLPLAQDPSLRVYRSLEVARDVYFSQVAHSLWLDYSRMMPWQLAQNSDHELSYLLSSKVYFTAWRSQTNNLYYVVSGEGASFEATENILQDPRLPFNFMKKEPEQGKCLIGNTPDETCQNLSEWFQDYLWHRPAGFDSNSFSKITLCYATV